MCAVVYGDGGMKANMYSCVEVYNVLLQIELSQKTKNLKEFGHLD